MSNYYFLGSILPDLQIGKALDLSFAELMTLLQDNLSSRDLAKVQVVRSLYDLYNLQAFWKNESFSSFGNLNLNDMEEAIIVQHGLPAYVFSFFDTYVTNEEKLKHFPSLLATFFKEEIARASGAFKEYLILERDLRLILLAWRAKQLGRNVAEELQFEDLNDELVAQILAQKGSSEYVLPAKYEGLHAVLVKYQNHPIELEKALMEYRFKMMNESVELDQFSIDRILVYTIELATLERWQRLDKVKGLKIVETHLAAVESAYSCSSK